MWDMLYLREDFPIDAFITFNLKSGKDAQSYANIFYMRY